MHGSGKSDNPIVPGKRPNNGSGEPDRAEAVEGRGLAKGNARQQNVGRTQGRETTSSELRRIRQVAVQRKEERFTALWHHVCKMDQLREAYGQLKPKSSPGTDGRTWQQYRQTLEENLQDLSSRLRRGAYRAKPVKRIYVPKGETSRRPIGIPVLEDKIVQRSTVEVLNAIYEADFKNFSHGFRPGRSPHQALDALHVALTRRKVSWVLDADIRAFFDRLEHEWLIKFIKHRIADRRVVRHIQKWLNAGVLEDGKKILAQEGTPQGGNISPLLANIYLHYVLDLWVDQWRRKQAQGEVIIVRYADDFVMGFQHRADATRFLSELKERFQKFGLELNEEKTRLVEFGRFAAENRQRRGEGKPESFDFLGFTHLCGKTKAGQFTVKRQTARKKMRAKLKQIKGELRKRMHLSVTDVGRYLRSVLRGHYNYYGIPGNTRRLSAFRYWVGLHWHKTLRRRSQKDHTTWHQTVRLIRAWFPVPRTVHPYPWQRLVVTTRGRSPVH